MSTLTYKIEFKSFWHTGSGLSSGTAADLVVIKDLNGLPYIPGKTLKGLFREAANELYHYDSSLVSKAFIQDVFGDDTEESMDEPSKAAISFFSNATLSEAIRSYLMQHNELKSGLFKTVASTKIDAHGQAEDHSLRQMEVTIPLELYSVVIDFPEAYSKAMDACFKWVKRLGQNRNRGLGSCIISTIKID